MTLFISPIPQEPLLYPSRTNIQLAKQLDRLYIGQYYIYSRTNWWLFYL